MIPYTAISEKTSNQTPQQSDNACFLTKNCPAQRPINHSVTHNLNFADLANGFDIAISVAALTQR